MRSMPTELRETDTICMTSKGTDIEPIAQKEEDIIITTGIYMYSRVMLLLVESESRERILVILPLGSWGSWRIVQ